MVSAGLSRTAFTAGKMADRSADIITKIIILFIAGPQQVGMQNC